MASRSAVQPAILAAARSGDGAASVWLAVGEGDVEARQPAGSCRRQQGDENDAIDRADELDDRGSRGARLSWPTWYAARVWSLVDRVHRWGAVSGIV